MSEASVALFTANFISGALYSRFNKTKRVADGSEKREGGGREQWMYELARNSVQMRRKVSGSAVCFSSRVYSGEDEFCAYARREATGMVHTSYLRFSLSDGNSSEANMWRNLHITHPTDKVLQVHMHTDGDGVNDYDLLPAKLAYSHDLWSSPHYDCKGGNGWVVTYLAPFLYPKLLDDDTRTSVVHQYGGFVSVDIGIELLHINQCDDASNMSEGDAFQGSHLCDHETSVCETKQLWIGSSSRLSDLEHKLGGYYCMCRKGYYAARGRAFVDLGGNRTGYNGTILEQDYRNTNDSESWTSSNYECLLCSEGCDECSDNRPCLYRRNPSTKTIALALNAIGMLTAILLGVFVICMRKTKIMMSGIPVLLVAMLCGTVCLFMSSSMRAVKESVTSCTFFRWFFNLGLPLLYGSIEFRALYLWRQNQATAARTKRLRLERSDIYKGMISLVVIFVIFLTVWTIVSLPYPEEKVANGLIFHRCGFTYLSYYYLCLLIHLLLLGFGLYLSIQVYNIPSYFNEGKLIALSIVNLSFVYSLFVTLMLFMKSYNPDNGFLLYAVIIHVTCDIPMGLLLGPRVYFIARGKGAMMMTSSVHASFLHTMTVAGYYVSDDESSNSSLKDMRSSSSEENSDAHMTEGSIDMVASPRSVITETTIVREDDDDTLEECTVMPSITLTKAHDDMVINDDGDSIDIKNKMQPVSTHTFQLLTSHSSEKEPVNSDSLHAIWKNRETRRKSIENVLGVEGKKSEKRRKSTEHILGIEGIYKSKRRQSTDILSTAKERGAGGRRKTVGDVQPLADPVDTCRPELKTRLSKPFLLKLAQPRPVVSPLALPPVLEHRLKQQNRNNSRYARRASVAGEVFETIVEFSSSGEKLHEETRVKNIYEILLERQARRGSSGASKLAGVSTTGSGSVDHIDKCVENGLGANTTSEVVDNNDNTFIDDNISGYDSEYGTEI